MSLLSSASLWTNDTNISKKRTPALRKTLKKQPTSQSFQPASYENETIIEENEYITETNGSIENDQTSQAERNERVSHLLNKLTADNDGNHLVDFQPLLPPIIQNKSQTSEIAETSSYHPLQIPPPPPRLQPTASNFSANETDLGNSYMPSSNYRKVYDPANTRIGIPYGGQTIPLPSRYDDKMMEKINYMIYMLEQQHNEKTNNITEEFILYSFLGVFIIFIVDSFARTGKYTR